MRYYVLCFNNGRPVTVNNTVTIYDNPFTADYHKQKLIKELDKGLCLHEANLYIASEPIPEHITEREEL